jgi:hypothetical protein
MMLARDRAVQIGQGLLIIERLDLGQQGAEQLKGAIGFGLEPGVVGKGLRIEPIVVGALVEQNSCSARRVRSGGGRYRNVRK